jgi:parallel beta-helix repeat protein
MSRSSQAILVCALVSVLAPSAGQASASRLSCGDKIKADTKLHRDLINCPDNGIVIGADDITLDLNGHTIDGDDKLVAHCGRREVCDAGVDNTSGRAGLVIEDGKIRQFGYGILIGEARENSLRRITSADNHFNGVTVFASQRFRLRESQVVRNGLTVDFPGVAMFDSARNRIVRNQLSGNADIGLYAIGVDHTRVARNRMSRNPEVGLLLEGAGNRIARNRMFRDGVGIAFSGNGNLAERNRVAASREAGISFEGGDHNLVLHNQVRRSHRDGILQGSFATKGRDNAFLGNRVRGAGRDGLRVARKVAGLLLEGNRIGGARDDGIDARSDSTELTRNRAQRNGDLGIKAVQGAVDGGGNIARDNGDPRECRHVACL